MSLHAPLFCAICAAPCGLPRADVEPPPPGGGDATPLGDTDSTGSFAPAPGPELRAQAQGTSTRSWLHEWHVLKVTTGLCTTYTIRPPPSPGIQTHSTVTAQPIPDPLPPVIGLSSPVPTPAQTNSRCIPIHHYCLTKVQATIRRSMFNTGFSHEESMMLGWSLPKWVGYGPWVQSDDRGGEAFGQTADRRGWVGYWGGTGSQRERFRESGGHLGPFDLIDPSHVDPPEPAPLLNPPLTATPPLRVRPTQTTRFLALPEHIHTQIALHLLHLPDPSSSKWSSTSLTDAKNNKAKLLSPESISDLLSLTRTCALMRIIHLPSDVWRLMTLHSLHRWKLDLLARWRANPTGVGSASQLWIALDEDFVGPVEEAVVRTNFATRRGDGPCMDGRLNDRGVLHDLGGGGVNEEGSEVSARDVFMWWRYGHGWRSRRRVWYCVVHATTTARDADWW